MIQPIRGTKMPQQESKLRTLKAVRWGDSEWEWLAKIAKSVGMTRSEFVRQSAMTAATATSAGLTPYFVGGPKVTPQNTGANHCLEPIAQQGVEGSGSRRSRTPQEPKANGGPNSGGERGGPATHELTRRPFRASGKS